MDWFDHTIIVYFYNSTVLYCIVCIVTHIARVVWINRLRFASPAHGQLNRENEYFPLSAFAPENLASRDGFRSSVPRQPAHLHTQAESGAYLWNSSRVPRRRPFICLKPPNAIGSVSSLSIGSRNCVPMAFTDESRPAQGQ